jgi:uncharacterized protein (DUF3820 family)
MNEHSIMPTGKHQGKRMADIPANYLLWIFDNRRWGRRRDLLIYLMEHEAQLREQLQHEKRKTEIVKRLVDQINKDD